MRMCLRIVISAVLMTVTVAKVNDNVCTRLCTANCEPVCGYNSAGYRVFRNLCEMLKHNCVAKPGVELRPNDECPNIDDYCVSLCPRACTTEYNPVCASDGDVYRKFGNQCSLNAYNDCDRPEGTPTFTKVNLKLCCKKKCPRACNKKYLPICGFDGTKYKQFDNECIMKGYNDCLVKKNKKFKKVDFQKCKISVQCPRFCTADYNPVCAFDGFVHRTFGNPCSLSAYNNCDAPKDSPKFNEVDLSECDCPRRCPQTLIYAPVCGNNGNTFRIFESACAMENLNCQNPEKKSFKLVEFEQCDFLDCPRNCKDDIVYPICTFDGEEYRSFDNECLLSEYNECYGNPYQSSAG